MSTTIKGLAPQTVLRNYFHAKDENRPHLLEQVFARDAELIVINHAETISFPARTLGREAIADVLVRNFCQTYENVYSFYLRRPPADADAFYCGWLVGMSEKLSRSARIGCGRYDWSFAGTAPHLASRLTITIRAMEVLPPAELGALLGWVRSLSYPWCTAEEIARTAPRIPALAPVMQNVAAHED